MSHERMSVCARAARLHCTNSDLPPTRPYRAALLHPIQQCCPSQPTSHKQLSLPQALVPLRRFLCHCAVLRCAASPAGAKSPPSSKGLPSTPRTPGPPGPPKTAQNRLGGGGGKAAEHLKGLHRAVWVRASRRPLPLRRRRGTTLSHHLRLLLLVGGEVAVALPPLAAPPPARRHLRPDRPRHLGAVVEGERPWPVFSMSPADLRLRELQCKPNGNRRRPRRNTHSPQHGAAGAAGGRTHGPMAGSPAPDRFA